MLLVCLLLPAFAPPNGAPCGALTLTPHPARSYPERAAEPRLRGASPSHFARFPHLSMATDDDNEIKVTIKIKKPPPKDPPATIKIKKPPPKEAGPPASPTTLAIEAAFVQAASGMSGANYEFGLMEFIRATRDAYDEGVMVPALNLELSMCQQYTAGRPLQSDEIELRTVWLSLVYLTFERVGYESKSTGGFLGQSVAEDLRQKFYTFTVSRALAIPNPDIPPFTHTPTRALPVRHRQREEARLRPGGAEARRSSPKRRGAATHGAGGPQPGHAYMLLGHPSNGGGLRSELCELRARHASDKRREDE